jgi:tetratricopeptide (TPR) repeat protein
LFCNYPVALPFYLIGTALLFLAVFPRYLEAVIKYKLVWLAGAVLFISGMLLLPSQNHLLGDGMQRLADAGQKIMYTEPLDILVHRLIYLLVGSSIWSYRIVGFVTGLLYLNGIRLLVRFGTTPIEKAIIALAFLCTATIQFYFGYVESYGLINLFILYYLYSAWKCVKEERVTAAPVVFFVLATLSHLSGAALFPSLVFLYKDRFRWVTRFALPLAILAAGVVFYIGRYWRALVTLMPNDYSTYSLFSGAHLLDLLCVLLLVSPSFYLALISKRWEKTTTFTMIALAGTLLFTIVIDPVLGAVRDWDFLSVFALPLAGMIALRAPRRGIIVVILAATIVTRTIPWLVFNSELQTEFVKQILADDIHYSEHFAKGERLLSWGYLLRECGDFKGAEEAWKKRFTFTPEKPKTLSLIGQLQYRMARYPEACRSYLRLVEMEPDNLEYRYRAGYLLFQLGDYNYARKVLTDGTSEFRENPSTVRLLAGILAATGHHQEAIEIIEKNPFQDMDDYLPYVLAKSCLAVGRNDLARQLIDRAIELNYFNKSYRELADRIRQQ